MSFERQFALDGVSPFFPLPITLRAEEPDNRLVS